MIHMCVYLFLSTIYLDTVFIYYRQCGALHLAWQSFPFLVMNSTTVSVSVTLPNSLRCLTFGDTFEQRRRDLSVAAMSQAACCFLMGLETVEVWKAQHTFSKERYQCDFWWWIQPQFGRCDLADNLQGKSLEGVTFSSQPAEFDIWISFASSGIIYMVLDGFLDFFGFRLGRLGQESSTCRSSWIAILLAEWRWLLGIGTCSFNRSIGRNLILNVCVNNGKMISWARLVAVLTDQNFGHTVCVSRLEGVLVIWPRGCTPLAEKTRAS